MVAVPAEDCDLVVWNAKYFRKAQLWNKGKEKGWFGNPKEAWQSRYRIIQHLVTKEAGLVKLVFVGFRGR